MPELVPFNLNDRIHVELTEAGVEVYRRACASRGLAMPEPCDGPQGKRWYEIQAFAFIQAFGPLLRDRDPGRYFSLNVKVERAGGEEYF